MSSILKEKSYEEDVEVLLSQADVIIDNTIEKVNHELIHMYWNLGKLVSDYRKINNSNFGDYVVKNFTAALYLKRGARFNRNNIYIAMQFYELFPIIPLGG